MQVTQVLKHTTAGPSVSHSHWNYRGSGKLFSTFDLYSGNMGCWRSHRLALATNYDTHDISVLFKMRDCRFLPFRSVPSFSLWLVLADSVSIRDPIAHVSFHNSHSIDLLFIHSFDTNLFCLSRLHCSPCT